MPGAAGVVDCGTGVIVEPDEVSPGCVVAPDCVVPCGIVVASLGVDCVLLVGRDGIDEPFSGNSQRVPVNPDAHSQSGGFDPSVGGLSGNAAHVPPFKQSPS